MVLRGKTVLTIGLLLCWGLGIAQVQSYYFRHYQVENGLSHNTVFCTVQDSNGFQWFGTKDGLNRFDGYHFKVFHTNSNNGLDRDQISSLTLDSDGQLWVGTLKGLFRFDNQQEKLIPFIDTLRDIHNICPNGNNGLWFISRNTLHYYDHKNKTLREFSPSRYFTASSICRTGDGTIWVATTDGFLHRYDAASDRFSAFDMFTRLPSPASRWIVKIYPAGNNQIFVGTSSQGLKLFNVSSGSYEDVLTDNSDKTSVFVRDIAKYSDDEYWIGTESGIFILNMSTRKIVNLKKKYLDPYSISDNAIYTLYKDIEGGLWAGTYFGGINYYPKPHAPFQKYFPDYKENSIVGNVIREICEDQDGNLWMGTEDAGLNRLNPKTGEIKHFAPAGKKSDIAYSNIHGLLPIQDDLWVGTFEHGLDIIDIHTGKVKKHYAAGSSNPDLNSNFIVTFLKTRKGSVWVATSNGAYIFDPSSEKFTPSPIQSAGLFVSALLEDHAGIIWMATHSGGVFAYNPTNKIVRQFTAADTGNSISTNTVNALFEDSRHHLWMATEGGGLCRLDENRTKFVNYSTKNGLPSNFVFKVLEDNQGSLWITTSKGLVNMNPSTNGTTLYTKENGLLNDQFNYNSGYKDSKGRIYLGSLKGMISFDPAQFKSGSQFVSPLYITGFQVNNQEMAIGNDSSALKRSIVFTDKITLPHDQSSFSIDFAALGFTSPERTQYSYLMRGLDREWTNINTNRKVYFTNLSPGTYEFKVKARNNILQSNNEKSLLITILPPLWATWWAYLVYILTGAGLLFYLVRSYHQLQEDKKEREIYKAKIDFFTNLAHEIRTPLTLIKGPVENLSELADELPAISEDVKTMERNTGRLINLVNQILDFRQTEMKGFSLDFGMVDIQAVLKEGYLTFEPLAKKRKIDYRLDLSDRDTNTMADEEALRKIFSNVIGNAVKYADNKVVIKMVPPGDEAVALEVQIMSDGYLIPAEVKEKIFEPFFRIKETRKAKGTGIGLSLARSLVELHGGNLYLKDPDGMMNVFVVQLPFQVNKTIAGTKVLIPENQLKSF